MKKILSTIFSVIIISATVSAQNAKPYFQQEVNYTIAVKLDDIKHELNATETIEYINNSPDALTEIYMHLWPNAYRDNNSALACQMLEAGNTKLQFAKDEDRGYIDQLDFKVNGEPVKFEIDQKFQDIGKIILNKPLNPGEKMLISTPFHVKLPLGIYSRMGHLGQAYQVTQWYPKPAVYDRNGWNQMPYLNQGEFYSEFGSFDVSITLPENYVVGATGDLIDGEKEIAWLNGKAEATKQLTTFSKDMSFPESSPNMKTLRYQQSQVHDFAWFADKRWHVLKGEVKLPQSGRTVTTWSMFTNSEADLWMKSIEYLNDAIFYYSKWNGDYPYDQCTAVDGALSAGAGMEYPNVTVIGPSGTAFQLETVIMHEVGHNWFYGILGSNERQHPWMDEGLNSFNENRYIETKYPDSRLADMFGDRMPIAKTFHIDHFKHKAQYELAYLFNARRGLDQPIELPANEYTGFNYGGIVYSKTAIVFDYLMAYLGNDVMDKAMHKYFETWKFKHPEPADLRKILEETSGKDLTWFFEDMIKTTKYLDYKIVKAGNSSGSSVVVLKNTGDIKGPVSVSGFKDGKRRASIWYDGFEGTQTFNFPPGDYDKFMIDYELDMPEISRKNNTLKTRGLFKKVEPVAFQFMGSIEDPNKTQVFYSPIAGWNSNDGWMAGFTLNSSRVPEKKFDYSLSPMFGFNSKNLTGFAGAGYNFYPATNIHRIRIGVDAQSFAYVERFGKQLDYRKAAPYISFYLKPTYARSAMTQKFTYRSVLISENRFYDPVTRFNLTPATDISNIKTRRFPLLVFNDFQYTMDNDRTLNPYSFTGHLQQHVNFLKASVEARYKINYPKSKNGIEFRAFAGRFLYRRNGTPARFGFGMSGNTDYTYDLLYLGRNEPGGFLAHQFYENDGGFKNPTLTPLSNRWLMALNIKAQTPVKFFGIYVDAGIGNNTKTAANSSGIKYAAGGYVTIIPNMVEVYFPVIMSDKLPLSYMQKVRFTFNISKIKPFESLRAFSVKA